jgi:PAS domain S-box-containing protein
MKPTKAKLLEQKELDEELRLVNQYFQVENQQCKYLEKQLISDKQLHELIIQSAPVIIMILNKKGCIEMVNPYMEELSGYSLSEIKGNNWFKTFIPIHAQNETRQLFFKGINNIQTRGNVIPIVTKDGKELDISWYDNTIKNSEGYVTALLCIGHDVSNLYPNKQKDDNVLVKMGHEIRTPMNAIIGFSEILSEMITDPVQKDYLNTIKTSVQSLLTVLGHTKKSTQLSQKNDQIDFDNIIFQENAKILVVDDIATNRYVLSHYLKAFGFQILQAGDGNAAIDMAKAHKPDLIFMDYHMPLLNGYKAARIINNKKGLRQIPIVMITASVMQDTLVQIEKDGFSYIKKPFIKNEIIAKLMQFIPYTRKFDNEADIVNNIVNSMTCQCSHQMFCCRHNSTIRT